MLKQGDIVQGIAQQDRGEFIELDAGDDIDTFFDDMRRHWPQPADDDPMFDTARQRG
jgi:hypothetical protein